MAIELAYPAAQRGEEGMAREDGERLWGEELCAVDDQTRLGVVTDLVSRRHRVGRVVQLHCDRCTRHCSVCPQLKTARSTKPHTTSSPQHTEHCAHTPHHTTPHHPTTSPSHPPAPRISSPTTPSYNHPTTPLSQHHTNPHRAQPSFAHPCGTPRRRAAASREQQRRRCLLCPPSPPPPPA